MEVKYKEWILETIDSLRSRKARPDLERICRMIERRHGLSPAETQQQLQNLVRAELVIKVAYKGSNSYRNAAKWYKNKQRKKQQPSPGSDQESNSKIVKAVVSLLHQQQQQQQQQQQPQQQQQQQPPPPPQQQQQQQQHSVCGREDKKGQRGVGIKEIEKYISSQEPKRKVTKARLLLALRREVTRGRLIHSPAGYYSLPQPGREQDERVTASARAASHKGYQRSRREKTLEGGPSLRNPPSDAASPASKCVKEQLKDIQECPELGLNTHKNESVQCSSSQINCKNKISGSSHPTRSSTFSNCGDLRKSHGMNGHTPGASGHSTDPWLYGECIGNHGEEATKRMLLVRLSSPDQTVRNDKTKEEAVPEQSAAVPDVRGASCLPTPSASPVEMENNENGSLDTKNLVENGKPLDPAEWTILDVFNYFKKAGFEEQAVAFQEQEIDGKSLLLMKRSDVLTGLSIKLGPALKIYEYHVKALQMRHLKSGSS